MDQDIQTILKNCKANKRAAQRKLYERFYSYGMSIAMRYLGDEQMAIEVLNNAFFKVFTKMKNFDVTSDFKPYFRRIVINASIDYMRSEKKHKNLEISDETIAYENDDILSRLNYQDLMHLVQSLTEAYRTVFNLYVIDGYKHNEIASILNISEGTSKSNLFKAKQILQQKVNQLFNNSVKNEAL